MDTATETGWDLAAIPTEYHNNYLSAFVLADYPDEKSDDSFNILWMGLT